MSDELSVQRDLNARQLAIIKALGLGNRRNAAASAAGVHRDTFYEWLKTNTLFADAVEVAEAQAEVSHVTCIANAAAMGDWRASLAWLQAQRREEWGANVAIRADREAREIIASLLTGDADGYPEAGANAEGEAPAQGGL